MQGNAAGAWRHLLYNQNIVVKSTVPRLFNYGHLYLGCGGGLQSSDCDDDNNVSDRWKQDLAKRGMKSGDTNFMELDER